MDDSTVSPVIQELETLRAMRPRDSDLITRVIDELKFAEQQAEYWRLKFVALNKKNGATS